MDIRKIDDGLSVSPQIALEDLKALAAQGFRAVMCNRPDGEDGGQPTFEEIARAARAAGLEASHVPVTSGMVRDEDADAFGKAMNTLPGPVLAYCRTGTRSAMLWSLSEAKDRPLPDILAKTRDAGYDMSGLTRRLASGRSVPTDTAERRFGVVIVGAGAAGIATAASLMARKGDLRIALIDPADVHFYQPGWTLVGAGIFAPEQTKKDMAGLIPRDVTWIKASVSAIEPHRNAVVLQDGTRVGYDRLVVCPGIKLDWDRVEGLAETLGRNGVTSNYRFDLPPYTWKLVQEMRSGTAIFTQPPMPFKCAGAPQKAMYLSADHWLRAGRLKDIDIRFNSAAGVLFGVKEYVPALMEYVRKYDASLNFFHNLVAIDGPGRTATFEVAEPGAQPRRVDMAFDMIHVCPPQTAPDFIRASPLADAEGWVDVNKNSLRHATHDNIWSLGDASSAPNAKTAAAARKQAPVVAENIVADIEGRAAAARYDGYGSCPLTVERGKALLAEFLYGGVLAPSFPSFVLDGTRPSRAAWFLKEKILPAVYWQAMLRGREWMARPDKPVPAPEAAE